MTWLVKLLIPTILTFLQNEWEKKEQEILDEIKEKNPQFPTECIDNITDILFGLVLKKLLGK